MSHETGFWATGAGAGLLRWTMRLWLIPLAFVFASLNLAACGDTGPRHEGADAASETGANTSSGDGDGDGDGEPEEIAGLELMTKLGGLWSGPASMTPLGVFNPMNMDLRAADGHTLFSRVDLDANNSLRFGFSIETIGGQDQLVYRNGGYFLGLPRDSRTILVEHTANTWRFCAVDGGCDYIDALWELQSETELVFEVEVMGNPHVHWLAERVEVRTLPDPFPADQSSQGNGDAPFPAMPSLKATVSWQDPVEETADVWLLLSTQACPLADFCDLSRSIMATVEAGATSVELLVEQVHAGAYKANAVLDRDRNLSESLFPGDGDAVSLPNQDVAIADSGESTASLSLAVEL